VLVRTDISLADQVVQVAHVCLEAGYRFGRPAGESCPLVLLGVPSEAHLRDAVTWLEASGARCATFYEPDDELGWTAACTEPLDHSCRRLLRRFPLWHPGRPIVP
jgi:hypothetical protein